MIFKNEQMEKFIRFTIYKDDLLTHLKINQEF